MSSDRVAVKLTHHGPLRADDRKPQGTKCSEDCRTATGQICHCTVCHADFYGVTPFDMHRDSGYCYHPDTLTLELDEGLWATPEGHTSRRVVAERLAGARASRGQPKT